MLHAHQISKTYRTGEVPFTALHQTDITVDAGEFTALCGPSGSGKTTLLNILGCIDSSDSGTISLNGEELDTADRDALARVRRESFGFIFQTYNLIPVLSVYENIALPLTLLGKKDGPEVRREIEDMLARVGLEGLADRRPLQLSGGQQQRVSIARALIKRPALIFADEPTANLDSETGEAIIDLMRERNRNEGITFLFSTHDELIMKHATRIIAIRDGRLEGQEV